MAFFHGLKVIKVLENFKSSSKTTSVLVLGSLSAWRFGAGEAAHPCEGVCECPDAPARRHGVHDSASWPQAFESRPCSLRLHVLARKPHMPGAQTLAALGNWTRWQAKLQ